MSEFIRDNGYEFIYFTGIWHIYEIEMWDEGYCNMEVQAYIEIRKGDIGNF